MNALLLQNIAPELAEHVKRVARNERCTINDAVLALLQRGIAANDAPRLVAPVVSGCDAPTDVQAAVEFDPPSAPATPSAPETFADPEVVPAIATRSACPHPVATPAPEQGDAPVEAVAAPPEPILPESFDGTPEERAIAVAETVALREALLAARDIP